MVQRKARKKTVARKKPKTKELDYNKKALWKAYRELQVRADKAWEKFRDDVKQNASAKVLVQDHNHLLLLLGECNYMARECTRLANQAKSKKKSR